MGLLKLENRDLSKLPLTIIYILSITNSLADIYAALLSHISRSQQPVILPTPPNAFSNKRGLPADLPLFSLSSLGLFRFPPEVQLLELSASEAETHSNTATLTLHKEIMYQLNFLSLRFK